MICSVLATTRTPFSGAHPPRPSLSHLTPFWTSKCFRIGLVLPVSCMMPLTLLLMETEQ